MPAASCTFWMLDADFVRNFSGRKLPFMQEIRDGEHSDKLSEKTLNYGEVVQGTHIENILAVSHR